MSLQILNHAGIELYIGNHTDLYIIFDNGEEQHSIIISKHGVACGPIDGDCTEFPDFIAFPRATLP